MKYFTSSASVFLFPILWLKCFNYRSQEIFPLANEGEMDQSQVEKWGEESQLPFQSSVLELQSPAFPGNENPCQQLVAKTTAGKGSVRSDFNLSAEHPGFYEKKKKTTKMSVLWNCWMQILPSLGFHPGETGRNFSFQSDHCSSAWMTCHPNFFFF